MHIKVMKLIDIVEMKLWEKDARRMESRRATSDSAVRDYTGGIENGHISDDMLSRIMGSLKEERKSQVRLLKRHKAKFRKNSLWDKKQRNGKVICIEPKNYQKLG